MVVTTAIFTSSCTKSSFLEAKPNQSILIANTVGDFNNLLENTSIINITGGALAQMSGDEYNIINYDEWQALSSNTQINSYVWAKDIYGGENAISDWNVPYKTIFYTNAVLDGLEKSNERHSMVGQSLRGRALFVRSYAFYDLIRTFCKAYDPKTSDTDMGIPLKLSSAIENTIERSTLQESFDRVIADLKESEPLLPVERPSANLNRPSKIAVFALMARIYLDMRNYEQAEEYADKCLASYSLLIDYNTLSKTATTPFTTTNDELIYNTTQAPFSFELTGAGNNSIAKINPAVISLYTANDLRLPIYFTLNATTGSYTKKIGYYGLYSYPFTGLATDEIYLIKAECAARRGDVSTCMSRLNQLASKRWNPSATIPAKPFINITANNSEEAIKRVLLERSKELIWRGIRWNDLKRLNKEGFGIDLTRTLNGVTYTLPANDPRWIFPIPSEEITASNIKQNIR